MNLNFTPALRLIIKPLIGLLLRNGVAMGDLMKIIKQCYVEEAERELLTSQQKTTTSRIAIITGLTRKEVGALRKADCPELSQGKNFNRAYRVVSAWISDPDFCDQNEKALVLKVSGDTASFESLVGRYSGDMPYRAVLDELLRTETVALDGLGNVSLLKTAFLANDDENEKYALLGEDVGLLISTIKHNIIKSEDEVPFYQRKVSYDRIPIECLAEFREFAERENQALLIKLNAWLAKKDMYQNEDQSSEQPMKVGVGLFYFERPSGNPKNESTE